LFENCSQTSAPTIGRFRWVAWDGKRGEICARRPVSRVLSHGYPWRRPFIWDVRYRTPHATDPGDYAKARLVPAKRPKTVAPIWSCSRWGLPCRSRCRVRGALLPHPFTLTAADSGGLLSVALSLGSPPPDVIRHRASVEPGLSSPHVAVQGGRPAVWRGRIVAIAAGGVKDGVSTVNKENFRKKSLVFTVIAIR